MWKQFLERIGFSRAKATDIKDLQPGQRCWIEGASIGIPHAHPAPFSGTMAATMTIEQTQLLHQLGDTLGANSHRQWRTVNDIDFGQTFFVQDATGLIRVDRQGWSKLRVPHTLAERVPKERRIESLGRFREAFAEHPLLVELERIGLDPHVAEVRNSEGVVPERTRIRVYGDVRSTGEPPPSGGSFPVRSTSFCEAPRLLELIPPGQDKLIIEMA